MDFSLSPTALDFGRIFFILYGLQILIASDLDALRFKIVFDFRRSLIITKSHEFLSENDIGLPGIQGWSAFGLVRRLMFYDARF